MIYLIDGSSIIRECLWRVPVALTHMVDKEEKSRASLERGCKVSMI